MNSSFNISSIALCLGKQLCVQALSLFGVPLQSLRPFNKSNDKALGKSSDLFGCESTSRWEGTSLHCFHQWPSLSGLEKHQIIKNKLRELLLAFVSSTFKDVTRLVLSKDPAKVRMIHTKIGSFKPAQLQIQSLFVEILQSQQTGEPARWKASVSLKQLPNYVRPSTFSCIKPLRNKPFRSKVLQHLSSPQQEFSMFSDV